MLRGFFDKLYNDIGFQKYTITTISLLLAFGGYLVTVVVWYASGLQFRADPDQFIQFEQFSIFLTTGVYFRILAWTYGLLSGAAIVGAILYQYGLSHKYGKWILFEIYTIGVIRSIFGLFFERRYILFGYLIMFGLILFGTFIVSIIGSHDRKIASRAFGIQVLLSVVFFVLIPIEIGELAPTFID